MARIILLQDVLLQQMLRILRLRLRQRLRLGSASDLRRKFCPYLEP